MSGASVAGLGSAQQQEIEERTYRKVTLRIVPFLFICYLAAYLDRVNVGFAKLQMLHDLNFSEAVYGLGAGIFFLGYFLFEVPSNLLMMEIVGADDFPRSLRRGLDLDVRWSSIKTSLGCSTCCACFSACSKRAFIQGIILYLTYWYSGASDAGASPPSS